MARCSGRSLLTRTPTMTDDITGDLNQPAPEGAAADWRYIAPVP
jgi:hypothetical protein